MARLLAPVGDDFATAQHSERQDRDREDGEEHAADPVQPERVVHLKEHVWDPDHPIDHEDDFRSVECCLGSWTAKWLHAGSVTRLVLCP